MIIGKTWQTLAEDLMAWTNTEFTPTGAWIDSYTRRHNNQASQQPGQFSYTPPSPSQQDANMEYYPPEGHNQYLENDRANDQNGQSHSAEDAKQFASL
jgi:hypothetical protein